MTQTMTIPVDDEEIGQGYNSVTRESVGTALDVARVSEDLVHRFVETNHVGGIHFCRRGL